MDIVAARSNKKTIKIFNWINWFRFQKRCPLKKPKRLTDALLQKTIVNGNQLEQACNHTLCKSSWLNAKNIQRFKQKYQAVSKTSFYYAFLWWVIGYYTVHVETY